jgi:hypothetical protein
MKDDTVHALGGSGITRRHVFGAARVVTAALSSLPILQSVVRAQTPPRTEKVMEATENNIENTLVGHWKLAGDSKDYSGNGNHGQNSSADLAAADPDAKPNGAAKFDCRSALMEVATSRTLRFGTGNITIAVWVNTAADLDNVLGDIVNKYDPVKRQGFTFSINNVGVTSSQPNYRNIHFGIDNGIIDDSWKDCGRLGHAVLVYSLVVHDNQLYAGTCEPATDEAGHVYRYKSGADWIDCGSPDKCNAVSALANYDGKLYAGVSQYRLRGSALPESDNLHPGGKIYRYQGGRKWADCGKLPDAQAINGIAVYRGQLYASSMYAPGGLFRYDGGKKWTSCGNPDGKRAEALFVYNGSLYATGYDEGAVYRYDGYSWENCGTLGDSVQTYSFAIYEGQMYVGAWPSGKVFRYGSDNKWVDVGRLGNESEVMGMMVYNGKLYGGTLPLAEVYRYDGDFMWTKVGRLDFTPGVKYRRAWTMAIFQGKLFCGTLPSGRVYSLEAGKNVTYDKAVGPGWNHLAAIKDHHRLKLYVNGKLVATSSSFDPVKYDLSNDEALRIGFGNQNVLNGSLRDLRIYSCALGSADVSRLFRGGMKG